MVLADEIRHINEYCDEIEMVINDFMLKAKANQSMTLDEIWNMMIRIKSANQMVVNCTQMIMNEMIGPFEKIVKDNE